MEYVIENKELFRTSLLKKRYKNLKKKTFCGQQTLFKTVKPLVYDKVTGKDKTHLIENDELLKTDLETAKVLNTFLVV